MNIKESRGESSCKRQENGDDSIGSERPLKKARFAWQVKGKYHLKNDSSENSSSTHKHEPEKPSSSLQTQSSRENAEQNLEILGDYLLKQDFNTLDAVISDNDKSLLKPSSSLSTEKLEYPRYVSSFENNGTRTYSTARSDRMIPMSLVATRSFNEDQCIARWQARQMAKGFVDNTINRVLDSWMIAPLPADVDNRFLALDVAEFINNLPGDNSIENEGILMAISAHGLQNNSASNNNIENNDEQASSSSSNKQNYNTQSSSPTHSDHESRESKRKRQKRSYDMAWTYEDESEMNNPHAPFSLFPETSTLHYDNDNQNSNIGFDDSNSNNNDLLSSHYDFMDAAVSFAIQNKGLTSFGTDYG